MLKDATVIAIGDLHGGSSVGLFPTDGITPKGGNRILPNRLQDEINVHYRGFWARVKKLPEPRVLILTGDCIEGRHHDETQVWGSPFDQLECIESMLKPFMSMFKYRFSVNGTAVHVGNEGCADEALATRLEFTAIGGRVSQAQLRVTIAGALFDVAHEGPRAGKDPITRGNALRNYANRMAASDLLVRQRAPDCIIRAHGHKKCYEVGCVDSHVVHAILTPAWKARDDYGHRSSAYQHLADVGGTIIRVENKRIVDVSFDCLEFPDVGEGAV